MTSLFLLSLFLIGAADAPSEEVWTLRGTVKDPGNTPLVGATVMVVGTSLGAMTNQNGEYLISNIPIDKLSCQARMVGMGESTIEVLASTGDTAEVHFYLPANPSNPLARPVITIDQQLVETVFTDTLEIVLGNWHELDMKHNQCWGRGGLMPSWQENDSTVCALLPRNPADAAFAPFAEACTRQALSSAGTESGTGRSSRWQPLSQAHHQDERKGYAPFPEKSS